MAHISLLGCGTWGSTLAQVLGRNGHSVTAWHYKMDVVDNMIRSRMHPNISDFEFHSNIIFKKEIQTCIEGSNCIVVAVPSHGVRNIIEKSSSFFTNKVILVNVAKGIENGTLSTMSEVIKDSSNLDSGQIVSLYGPSHAEEVIKGDPTTLVSASSEKSSAEYVQTIFSSDTLRVYTNNDIKGVELGGSLKNVIAIAAGICDGIGFGDNSKAALMTRGIAEITRLGVAMGVNSDTFSGLSGIGDLIVTCLSIHSRNRYVGEEIGKGKTLVSILDKMDMVAEGIRTTQSVYDLSKKYQVEMPISEGVYQILFNEKNPKEIVSELMTRDLKLE
tara:strand:- start:870 stop:1862 length:993 start_codon:yes stop_codon:yes gene_type:complete